jgi:hypothetical protein
VAARASHHQLLRFPGRELRSLDDFEIYSRATSDQLELRRRYEQKLAGADQIVQAGTCVPCLRTTNFCSVPDATASGGMEMNWREQQLCDCSLAINNRSRAIVHLMLAKLGLWASSRVLITGEDSPLHLLLSQNIAGVEYRPTMQAPGEAHFDLIYSVEQLDRVSSVEEQLDTFFACLRPHGALLLSMPFHVNKRLSVFTASEAGTGPAHAIGWDVLTMLRDAGFEDAWVESYWSEEFGYLGPDNFLFVALKGGAP